MTALDLDLEPDWQTTLILSFKDTEDTDPVAITGPLCMWRTDITSSPPTQGDSLVPGSTSTRYNIGSWLLLGTCYHEFKIALFQAVNTFML